MASARKVALVTGAAQGLGKAFSEVLLKRGAQVCLVDIDDKLGSETSQIFNEQYGKDATIFIKCDAQHTENIKSAFAEAERQLGKLDIVVNNAGIMNERAWEKMLDINLKGVIQGTQLAMESMRTDKGGQGGHIINVASLAGLLPVPFGPVYCASKHAIMGYSRSLNHEYYQKLGIKVSCLCPGYTNTSIMNIAPEIVVDVDIANKSINAVGTLEIPEVASAFEHLLDKESSSGGNYLQISKAFGEHYVQYPTIMQMISKE